MTLPVLDVIDYVLNLALALCSLCFLFNIPPTSKKKNVLYLPVKYFDNKYFQDYMQKKKRKSNFKIITILNVLVLCPYVRPLTNKDEY